MNHNPHQVPNLPIELKGGLGEHVTFDGYTVTITRDRVTPAGKGTRIIPVSAITGVLWHPKTMWSGGFIRFATAADVTAPTTEFGKQTGAAIKDPHAILIPRKGQPAFEHLRDAVLAAISSR